MWLCLKNKIYNKINIYEKNNNLNLIFFVLILFFVPINIKALSYKSNFVNLKGSHKFLTDEFTLNLEYETFIENSSEKLDTIAVNATGKSKDYQYHYIIYYYDSNKKEIGASDGYNSMNCEPYSSYSNIYLEQSNMYNGYEISDIKYYKLFIEPSTNEMVRDYLFFNKKLNQNGLDEISDFNTIQMISMLKEDVNNDSTYTLNSYDIDIVVNENNTLNVTEKIEVYFNTENHGIIRKIPLRNEMINLDGTTTIKESKINEIKVNDNYFATIENGYQVIEIGDKNNTLKGKKNYEISYLYSFSKDTRNELDELYFNLINKEWNTNIDNITFSIIMPKKFDSSKIVFLSSLNSSNINYNVDGNIITGRFEDTFKSGNELILKIELPDGYFLNTSSNILSNYYLMFIIPIIGLLISFILWRKFGKDEKLIVTLEFYPPQGFNSLEIGFLYKGKADYNDVASLILYLASKGYIKITETAGNSIYTKDKKIIITKLKEYDGSNEHERILLSRLFEEDVVDSVKAKKIMSEAKSKDKKVSYLEAREEARYKAKQQSITIDDLDYIFNRFVNEIISNINENKKDIFEKNTRPKIVSALLFVIVSIIIISIPTLEYSGVNQLIYTLFTCLIPILICYIALLFKDNIIALLIILSIGILYLINSLSTLPIISIIKNDYLYLVELVFGIISVIIMGLLFRKMTKRTKYGNEMLGKIKGFVKFIETSDKQTLETILRENPTYFYDILPFAYALGLSDILFKKFETNLLKKPDWYDGDTSFDIKSFNIFINSTIKATLKKLSSNSHDNI